MKSAKRLITNRNPVEDTPTKRPNVWMGLSTNLAAPATIKYRLLEGKSYAVVPMVMITSGVHNGSSGNLFYPDDELGKTPQSWDHKPIVIYHPTINGAGVSACKPEVLETQKVGLILNTTYEYSKKAGPGRLKAEAWLDMKKLKSVDKRVYNSLKKGEMVEVSTGLFIDGEETPGTYKTKAYDVIATNYRPDHLAILPDQIGACSIAAGAGLLRNQKSSFGEKREQIESAIQQTLPKDPKNSHANYIYVRDLYDTFAVYSSSGKMYKQDYTFSEDDGVTLKGLPVEVKSRQTYKTLGGTVLNLGVLNMKAKSKKSIVSSLIANAVTRWAEKDREFLLAQDTDVLRKMLPAKQPVINQVDPEDDEDDETEEAAPQSKPTNNHKAPKKKLAPVMNQDDDEDGEDGEAPTNNEAPATLEAYLGKMPPALRDTVTSAMQQQAVMKTNLVAAIVANASNPFKKEFLETKGIEELQGLATLAAASAPAAQSQQSQVLNYEGQGNPFYRNPLLGKKEDKQQEITPLETPTLNFAMKGKRVNRMAAMIQDVEESEDDE